MGGEIASCGGNGPLLNRGACREFGVFDEVDIAPSDMISTIIPADPTTLTLPFNMAFASLAPKGVLKFMIAERISGSAVGSGASTSTPMRSLDHRAIKRTCSSDVFNGRLRIKTDDPAGGDGVGPKGVPMGLVALRSNMFGGWVVWNDAWDPTVGLKLEDWGAKDEGGIVTVLAEVAEWEYWLARFATPSEYCGFADALEAAPTALWSMLITIDRSACAGSRFRLESDCCDAGSTRVRPRRRK